MPTLMITTAYEGEPRGELRPGRPVTGVPLEVGGLGRDILTATTDDAGTATVDLPDGGSWTVSATQDLDDGALLGLMTVQVAGPVAMLALPVRFRPA